MRSGEARMNRETNPQSVSAAGKNIVTWLTVLQFVSLLSAAAYLVLALLPGTANAAAFGGLPRPFTLGLSAFQLVSALVYFLVLHWTKGWMTNVRLWATGEGAPNRAAVARERRTLGGWIVFGQWFPLLALLIALPLTYFAFGQIDPALFDSPALSDANLAPEQVRALAQVSIVVTLVAFGLPSFLINYAVLGWIRRWMTGVSDALLGEAPPRETRLPELAATLSRWFTFFQALLVVFILFILVTPLLPSQAGANVLTERLNLLVSFLSLALWVALLQWSKVFLAGVTPRARSEQARLTDHA